MMLLDAEMVKYAPSILASAAIFASFKVIKGFSPWNAVLVKCSGYSEEEVSEMAQRIRQSFDKLKEQDLDGSVKRKYLKDKHSNVS